MSCTFEIILVVSRLVLRRQRMPSPASLSLGVSLRFQNSRPPVLTLAIICSPCPNPFSLTVDHSPHDRASRMHGSNAADSADVAHLRFVSRLAAHCGQPFSASLGLAIPPYISAAEGQAAVNFDLQTVTKMRPPIPVALNPVNNHVILCLPDGR